MSIVSIEKRATLTDAKIHITAPAEESEVASVMKPPCQEIELVLVVQYPKDHVEDQKDEKVGHYETAQRVCGEIRSLVPVPHDAVRVGD